MREIRFRYWDKSTNKMLYDVQDTYDWETIEHNECMQFTGLKDRNGKDIYESDIISIPYIDPMGGLHEDTKDGIFEVGFENGQFVLYRTEAQPITNWCKREEGEYVSNYGNKTIIQNITILEVIGNLYETPNLLQK